MDKQIKEIAKEIVKAFEPDGNCSFGAACKMPEFGNCQHCGTDFIEGKLKEFAKKVKNAPLSELELVGAVVQRKDIGTYNKAKQIVIITQKCAAITLQHYLTIGNHTARCIVEKLEFEGIVGPGGPGVKRRVLVKADQRG